MKNQTCYVFLLVAALSGSAAAQSSMPSVSSAISDAARFQIVQSPILAKLTFRLDRSSGETWQLVQKATGGFAWQPIQRIALPNDAKLEGKPNYQLYASGIRANITILMNTNTGIAWYIAENPKEGIFWSPLK